MYNDTVYTHFKNRDCVKGNGISEILMVSRPYISNFHEQINNGVKMG